MAVEGTICVMNGCDFRRVASCRRIKSGKALPSSNSADAHTRLCGPLNFGELMTYLQILLKVCERCGALWYRALDCQDVYCGGCAPRMRALPPPGRSRRQPRRRLHTRGGRQHGGAA